MAGTFYIRSGFSDYRSVARISGAKEDGIYENCSMSIHHYPDPEQFFLSLKRVLRPGGRLFKGYGIKQQPVDVADQSH